MPHVEFHFDFGSPNAYLAHLLIPEIEKRTGTPFEYVPVLLGGVFKLTNNRSPMESFQGVKNKLEYQRLETLRFIRRHGITRFAMNPFFPVNTLTIMRGAVAAQMEGEFARYVEEVFRHMWAEPKKKGGGRGGRRARGGRGRPRRRWRASSRATSRKCSATCGPSRRRWTTRRSRARRSTTPVSTARGSSR